MSDEGKEMKPTEVPEKAKQVGETRARWSWVEPCVWTDRMLTALEKGVKGGMWLSTLAKRLLCRAWAVLFRCSPCGGLSALSKVKPPTGEPCAGEPHARFGGRGPRATGDPYPYNYSRHKPFGFHPGTETGYSFSDIYALKNAPCVVGVYSQSEMSGGSQKGSKHQAVQEIPFFSK